MSGTGRAEIRATYDPDERVGRIHLPNGHVIRVHDVTHERLQKMLAAYIAEHGVRGERGDHRSADGLFRR